MRGYFGIGIENGKTELNLGTLWRSAFIFGASFIFTVGQRYKKQSSDTVCAWRHIPLYRYKSIDELNVPYDCPLIGIEIDSRATGIENFTHPQRALYLLGAEDSGLSERAIKRCSKLVVLPGEYCLNVAVAGSVVMYDRHLKVNRGAGFKTKDNQVGVI